MGMDYDNDYRCNNCEGSGYFDLPDGNEKACSVCHGAGGVDQSDIDKAINAFDVFKTMHPASRLSFSETDVIIKELIANKIELTRCPVCNCWNLLRARMDQVERCGVCKEHIKAK
jgi:RecJ-like exonuclease